MELKTTATKDMLEVLTKILSGNTAGFLDNSPSYGLDIGEQVLGTLDDQVARALWNLRKKIQDSMKEDTAEAQKSLDPEDKMMVDKVFRAMDNADDIARVCNTLFWVRVHMAFPQAHRHGLSVGVRNGWRVVAMKSADSPFSLLSRFLNPDQD